MQLHLVGLLDFTNDLKWHIENKLGIIIDVVSNFSNPIYFRVKDTNKFIIIIFDNKLIEPYFCYSYCGMVIPTSLNENKIKIEIEDNINKFNSNYNKDNLLKWAKPLSLLSKENYNDFEKYLMNERL